MVILTQKSKSAPHQCHYYQAHFDRGNLDPLQSPGHQHYLDCAWACTRAYWSAMDCRDRHFGLGNAPGATGVHRPLVREAGYEILIHPPSEGGTTLGGTSEEAGIRLDLVPQDQVQLTQLGRAQFLERAVRQCLKGVWLTRTVSNNSDQPQGRFRVRSWHQPMKANPGGY